MRHKAAWTLRLSETHSSFTVSDVAILAHAVAIAVVHGADESLWPAIPVVTVAMSCAATLPLGLALALAIHIHRIGLAAAMLLAGRAPPASAPAATAASATGLLGLVWSF